MGIGSWLKRLRQRGDAEAIQRAEERAGETPAERRLASEHIEDLQADEFAARSVREGNIEDAERFAEEEEGP
jgi:hypothetical protein